MVDRSYLAPLAQGEDDLAYGSPHRAGASPRDHYADFFPGEPIHAPPRRRGSSMAGALAMVLALSTSAWGLYQTESWWRPWAAPALEAAQAALEQALHGASPQAPSAAIGASAAAPIEPLSTRQIEQAAGDAAGVALPVPPSAIANAPVAAAPAPAGADKPDDGETTNIPPAAAEPLPPPEIDPTDPYQKRALAAGLHPQLSRALLSRLTEADYLNARVAIDKAVSTTRDGDKLTWPAQREPRLASFQVHFVAGAAPDCRRYVVTVTREGWSTTALPMERCGVKRQARAPS